jgi:hypothetical protein
MSRVTQKTEENKVKGQTMKDDSTMECNKGEACHFSGALAWQVNDYAVCGHFDVLGGARTLLVFEMRLGPTNLTRALHSR